MLRRHFLIPLMLLLAVAGISAAVYAQLETGDRGILPIDSSGTLEIGGIHVDVGGADAQSARYAGWRIAQRQDSARSGPRCTTRPSTRRQTCPTGRSTRS